MANSPPASAGPMPTTLATARIEIARLREKLGLSLPAGGSKPIPPDRDDPQPNPDRGVGPPDLASMTPAAFGSFIQKCGNKELSILLARETSKGRKQDSSVVGRLYRELKKRGV